MRKKIAVDSGKYETKAVLAVNNNAPSKDKTLKFMTRVKQGALSFETPGIHKVEYEGITYSVGALSGAPDPNSTKNTDDHKIAIYTAIGIMVEPECEVDVVIGCPLDIYGNLRDRRAYLANILPLDKKIEITINGKATSFIIKSARVMPEGSGVLYLDYARFSNEIVNIIDVGGLNVNGSQWKSLTIIPDSVFTENLGGNTIVLDLIDKLVEGGKERAKLLANYNVLEKAVADGSGNNIPAELIKELKMNKARQIKKACDTKDWDLDYVTAVFTGGTSILLKDELKEVFGVGDEAFYEDAVFSNAKGFLKYIRQRN